MLAALDGLEEPFLGSAPAAEGGWPRQSLNILPPGHAGPSQLYSGSLR